MSDIATKVKAIIVDKLGVDEKEVTPTITTSIGINKTTNTLANKIVFFFILLFSLLLKYVTLALSLTLLIAL